MVALVTIYIVDVSGFTDSWKKGLARFLNVKELRPLPPFDCGQCMTWWVCLFYAICTGVLSVWTIALSAFFSLMSSPIGRLLDGARERLEWLINKIYPKQW